MKLKLILLSLTLIAIASMVLSCKKNNNLAEAWQVASLQVQMAEVNGSISKLEQADEALKGDIKALEQAATKLQADVESSESDIADFRAKAQAKLDSINTVLNGLKAKETSLEGQIASLKTYMDEKFGQTRDWASATFATIEQYTAAMIEITTVKETVNSLNTSLAGMTTSVTQLQTTLAEIQTQFLVLLGRVEDLEDSFAGLIDRIQSVVVLPDYADGSVSCSSGDNYFQFEVLPSGTANLLAQAPVTAFTMKALYTKTKAQSFVSLPVSAVNAEGDVLIVTASGAQLNQDFFTGTVTANASLQIQSELSHYSTVYFPLYRASVAPPPEPLDIETDLSASATANCYIVAAAGKYKFKGNVKGNSTTALDGTPASAALLWESFGTSTAPSVNDIIATLSYEDGYVKFETPSTLKNGNAVIAVKDAGGNILWSWHIWVCAGYDPIATSQVYYNNAGTMMDRNLGAKTASLGSAGSLGLLYQWGRKDPFLGSRSTTSASKAKSSKSWPSAIASDSSTGTIAYTIKNPMTFIKGVYASGYDWSYTKESGRWGASKTMYDPCPPGWKVPSAGSSGVWAKAASSGSKTFTYDWNSSRGMNFSGKFGTESIIWYPAASWLKYNDGSLNSCLEDLSGYGAIIYLGHYWGYTTGTCLMIRNESGSPATVNPCFSTYCSYGYSVRCLQE